jgi:hypothetical protein
MSWPRECIENEACMAVTVDRAPLGIVSGSRAIPQFANGRVADHRSRTGMWPILSHPSFVHSLEIRLIWTLPQNAGGCSVTRRRIGFRSETRAQSVRMSPYWSAITVFESRASGRIPRMGPAPLAKTIRPSLGVRGGAGYVLRWRTPGFDWSD